MSVGREIALQSVYLVLQLPDLLLERGQILGSFRLHGEGLGKNRVQINQWYGRDYIPNEGSLVNTRTA